MEASQVKVSCACVPPGQWAWGNLGTVPYPLHLRFSKCNSTSPLCRLTHLALVHVPGTLVVIGERDEVGDHAEHAVREELLVCGDSGQNVTFKDGHVHEELWREGGTC